MFARHSTFNLCFAVESKKEGRVFNSSKFLRCRGGVGIRDPFEVHVTNFEKFELIVLMWFVC